MPDWKQILTRVASDLEKQLDTRRIRVARAAENLTIDIVPYRGFASRSGAFLKGRVLQQKLIIRGEGESLWRNVVNSYRRIQSDEVPGAKLRVRFAELTAEAMTDEEGFYELMLETPVHASDATSWREAQLELLQPAVREPVTATAHVLVPGSRCSFGIISDIDDTIVRTDATSMLRMAQAALLRSASERTPFEGVSELYEALRGPFGNPVFYVSSGPWNFYDLLEEFLHLQKIPVGPLLLSDFGIDERKLIHRSHDEHKLEQIERVMASYPDLKFVLIGDSGQEDPEIYQHVAATDPTRVLAIFIRDVTTAERDDEVHAIAAKVTSEWGIPMELVATTAEAASEARRLGLISV